MKKTIKTLSIISSIFLCIGLFSNSATAQNYNPQGPQILGFKLYEQISTHKKMCLKHQGKWDKISDYRYDCSNLDDGFKVFIKTDENNQVLLMTFYFATEEHGRALFYRTLSKWTNNHRDVYKIADDGKTHTFNINFWSIEFSEPRNGKGDGTHSIYIYDLNHLIAI